MISRLKTYHEKSIAILELIEQADRKLKSSRANYKYIQNVFDNFWSNRLKYEHQIDITRRAKERLVEYYANYQMKHLKMIELGNTLKSVA